ncbi:hypothetical protein GP486_006065 [Trichoglossum hirsutum]|uniref:Brix domain-containing protein n=1 Tax=Trichoglossum hirsutum TaxID=265104 RepID=A0A9P8RLG8_9PEZI|nr:hypothetical protein GP486_006065 [Trichoglossum hirsutum]
MARRRTKKRTHTGARNGPSGSNVAVDRSPKSMVVRMGAGEVGPSISQLVRDVRAMMEPGTAARLKERKANRLRDYITMAGPLHVSHLLLFSRSTSGNTNLRIALTPRGPTLHFRVENYSLCKDVVKSIKHPKGGKKEFLTPPLLVMNNFVSSQPTQDSSSSKPKSNGIPKHLETLTTSIFQSLFPPISPQTTPLSSIRRVLLLNRELPSPKSADPDSMETETGTYTINLRHYAITTRSTGLSRSIRRLKAAEKLVTSREKRRKGVPNLGRLEDVADYILDPSAAASGYTSASETDIETDAEVEVLEPATKKVLSGAQRRKISQQNGNGSNGGPSGGRSAEKRAVKLVELGPRMRLRMLKVEEGVCSGKVMWHEFLHKTKEEERALEQLWEARRKEKEDRRRKQKEDVERKRREREARKKRTDGDGDENMEDGDADEDEDEYERQEWDSEGLEGDAEMLLNEEKYEDDEWGNEIAAG